MRTTFEDPADEEIKAMLSEAEEIVRLGSNLHNLISKGFDMDKFIKSSIEQLEQGNFIVTPLDVEDL